VQLVFRDADGRAVGFVTLLWTWATWATGRRAVIGDLFVASDAWRMVHTIITLKLAGMSSKTTVGLTSPSAESDAPLPLLLVSHGAKVPSDTSPLCAACRRGLSHKSGAARGV
jgi:hypothetical protein